VAEYRRRLEGDTDNMPFISSRVVRGRICVDV
jgi:hypothetical protein